MSRSKIYTTEIEKEVKFREFDMTLIEPSKKLLFIGMTGSGKTTLLLDYLYHNKSTFPIGNVISKTEIVNRTFQSHIPKFLIFDEYDKKITESLIKHQKKNSIQYPKAFDPSTMHKASPFNMFLIMDDCLSDVGQWKKEKSIKQLFYEGRHYKITLLLTCQSPLGIPHDLRGNVDYIFLCRNSKVIEQRKCWEHFAGMFPTFKQFQTMFIEFTKNRGCMVIDALSQSTDLADQVFYYNPKSLNEPDWNDFKLCNKKLWAIDKQINSNDNKDDEIINVTNINYKFSKI